MKMNEQNRNLLILLSICVLTIFPLLGLTDYNTKGEPREAIVAYSMLEHGNWILPRNYGGEIAFKPPFLHWSVAAVSTLCGEVSEYSSRVPSALALIIMAAAIYWFYARRKGATVGLLTAFVMLTCFEVHRAGFTCRVDMVLTAFIVLAIIRFYSWYEKDLRGIPWLAILFMGCATLTKGPVGIILPCLVAGVFLWIRKGHFWKLVLRFIGIALLACVLPAIWYVLAYNEGKQEFLDLMMEENFGRFLGKMSYASHENPFYYNIYMLMAGYLPWTLLLLFSLFCLRYRKWTGTWKEKWQQTVEKVRTSDPVHLYSFLTIALIFVFYCIPASKRSVYLLPIYPFIGYFLAVYFFWLVRMGKTAIKIFAIVISCLIILLTVVFFVVKAGAVPDTIFAGKRAVENIAFLHALEEIPMNLFNIVLIFLPIVAVVVLLRKLKSKPWNTQVLYALCGLLFTIFVVLDGVYQPAVLNTKSDIGLAQEARKWVPEGKIYSYTYFFYSVNFFNGDRMALFEKELPEEGYVLVKQGLLEEFRQKYGEEYVLDTVYTSNRRSCDVRDIIHILHFTKKKAIGNAETEERF